ncbi:hypothetical protein [Paenibacillus sp. XY044]|uniref:hypothetical protein n=1 Tax=Paenibacillus sp. XY044 TaxID=2026089 RepID=UPI000B980CB8|nr:hypothetical protein [Paenibacillus sp. XY044]OZB98004.1 hypothetical protein CJP46_02235 [Paenibacillus sp. XY044]
MSEAEQWLRGNYLVGEMPIIGESIAWNDGINYYGIYTPVTAFLQLFGDVIQIALINRVDVKQAIRDSDPDNEKGYNDIL